MFHKVCFVDTTPYRLSTNITNRALAVCGAEMAPHMTPFTLCCCVHWLAQQRAAALTLYALTQAEGKVVPTNRLSFRQDPNSLVTFHCLNDIYYLKWLKYQQYRFLIWESILEHKDLVSEVSIVEYRSAHHYSQWYQVYSVCSSS